MPSTLRKVRFSRAITLRTGSLPRLANGFSEMKILPWFADCCCGPLPELPTELPTFSTAGSASASAAMRPCSGTRAW